MAVQPAKRRASAGIRATTAATAPQKRALTQRKVCEGDAHHRGAHVDDGLQRHGGQGREEGYPNVGAGGNWPSVGKEQGGRQMVRPGKQARRRRAARTFGSTGVARSRMM